jgi:hypothetical protein
LSKKQNERINPMSVTKALKETVQTQLDRWDKEIDEMEAQARAKEAEAEANDASAKLQREFYNKIEGVRKTVHDARQKLDSLQQAGDDALNDMIHRINKAVSDLQGHAK